MNAEQMKYESELLYESIASGDAPGYTNKEWSHFLTAGQEKVVKDIIREGLDKNESNRKGISPLFVPIESTDFTTYSNIPNAVYAEIDGGILGTTMERCLFKTDKVVRIKPITYDEYLVNIDNPFKKPDKSEVFWRLQGFINNTKVHILIADDNTDIEKYRFTGIKKPEPIILEDSSYDSDDGSIDGEAFADYDTKPLDCKLGTFLHRWIVKEAVKEAYGADKDQIGYQIAQTSNIEENKQK